MRYPDIVVTCQPVSGTDDIVPEPIVVIEVISPSTEREDRGRKKFDYFATPSIWQYAIVEQDERLIDLYTRAGDRWTDEIVEGDAVLKLSSIGVEVSLDVIYEDTERYSAARGRAANSGGVNTRSPSRTRITFLLAGSMRNGKIFNSSCTSAGPRPIRRFTE